eukprot:394497-Prymnesium_polylepis.1
MAPTTTAAMSSHGSSRSARLSERIALSSACASTRGTSRRLLASNALPAPAARVVSAAANSCGSCFQSGSGSSPPSSSKLASVAASPG